MQSRDYDLRHLHAEAAKLGVRASSAGYCASIASDLRHPDPELASAAPRRTVEVSVLVPVRNEALHLPETVASMQAQEFAGSIEFIFADGRSHDDTRAILEGLAAGDPRVRILENPQRLTPHGLNLCLRAARGRFVARMDGHAEYPSDYLAQGVQRLERGDVAWVSGPQLPRGRGWWSSRVTLALQSSLGRGGSRRWQSPGDGAGAQAEERPLTSGSGVFLGVWRRSTLLEFGGWDEGWPANQDVELAGRMEAQGERIVSLAAMGAHYIPRNSPVSLARQYFRYGFYRVKTSRRHPIALRLSHLGTPCIVIALTVSCLPAQRAGARLIRGGARAASGAYAAALLAGTARVARREARADWVLIPAVMAVMHVSWGVGFMAGCCRMGPPVEGCRRLVRGLLRRS